MKMYCNLVRPAFVAATLVASASLASGATIPVTGWAVHNGTSTVGGTASAPTFTAGDNITAMAPFGTVSLVNDGDSISISTVLTMNTRTGTGINTLNTQLRLGLFNGPAGAIAVNDIPNVGFIIEYTNVAAGGLIREQTSALQQSPFTSPTDIGNGSQDAGSDSIQGANPGPVTLQLTMTRSGGKLDLAGVISGTDSVTTNPYLATYAVSGYSSATFPANGTFSFNRIGLFLGPNVNAASASLANTTVTVIIPEPTSCLLAATLAIGGTMTRRKLWRTS